MPARVFLQDLFAPTGTGGERRRTGQPGRRNRTRALTRSTRRRDRRLTTAAVIAGVRPIASGFGGHASFRQPMAAAVIVGHMTSNTLRLQRVPVAFTCVDAVEKFFGRLFGGP